MALAGLKHGLRMVSQQAMRFYKRIGYHPYEGITEDFAERERIIAHLGMYRAMIFKNHGLLSVGKTAREAFVLIPYLMTACANQMRYKAGPSTRPRLLIWWSVLANTFAHMFSGTSLSSEPIT